MFSPTEAFVLDVPVVVKARLDGDRRLVEVEASNEQVDQQGDVIMQCALLNSADNFIAHGALDIDHKSELGDRMGIKDPNSYIIGRPIEVKDIGGGRTSVVGEIQRAADGIFDPKAHRYDDFWDSLQRNPPVVWRASVYGFPTADGLVEGPNEATGAKRYTIYGMVWKSLAFTRRPVNDAITHPAKIVTAKSYIDEISKVFPIEINNMMMAWRHRVCPACKCHEYPTTLAYRDHFEKCLGLPGGQAEILAHANMNFGRRIRST